MWPFNRHKKLEYETLWEWSQAVGEMPKTSEGQAQRIAELVQVRRRIWEKHVATLTD